MAAFLLMNFLTLEYLKSGNPKQRKAYQLLLQNKIFYKLRAFNPILVGTIPLEIDIESSDLDIICQAKDLFAFRETLQSNFEEFPGFELRETEGSGHKSVVVNFCLEGFPIEVFGQNIPSNKQLGYRHMMIEYKLLIKNGEAFRLKVIELKQQGLKTEPAFAHLLGLKGDPYTELLRLE